ncbi:DUF3152 domain-containing protein [Streptomyces sp. CWNU-1]|uniref:DUF3152 domain-containing protein n=1 Tax=Streptomyces albipurpureus TaxID=2897419 RepID=A0ABT0UKA8_9ACTN|nr:DUF3152 domain-containing protein [Streptomyces sp. CWNU-1]
MRESGTYGSGASGAVNPASRPRESRSYEPDAAARSLPAAPAGYQPAAFPSPPIDGGPARRNAQPTRPEHAAAGYGPAQARGGHPEQREAGGGWGTPQPPRANGVPGEPGRAGEAGGSPGRRDRQSGVRKPQRAGAPAGMPGVRGAMAQGPRIPGPRKEFVEAFDGGRPPASPDEAYASVTTWPDTTETVEQGTPDLAVPVDVRISPQRPKTSKGRTFTGVAAAAVTTVLAIVVAGQVAEETEKEPGTATTSEERGGEGPASRSDGRPAPAQQLEPAAPTYEQLMAAPFPIDPELTAGGTFEAVPGFDKAPGKGRKIRYQVDIEKGLGMDGLLFATAVQKTLNDERSWAHKGAMTFERISSGEPDFIITLASPGTTDVWCAKSDLDTSIEKVSCDSASTDRVMINAFRWAQGSDTYGPQAMYAYRQMLINHEVGHRLGHGHVNCSTKGALAPVMQQQTKSLKIKGITCRPNPWAHPEG